jgi:lactoylglutathione lyase
VSNVQQAVPFLRVTNMAASVHFYEQLGFAITRRWEPAGSLRWCWLEHGAASLMLQDARLEGTLGVGVSICFMCTDAIAIHDDVAARGVAPAEDPCVGNGLWVVSYRDPDGYRIDFESPTTVAEETRLSTYRQG